MSTKVVPVLGAAGYVKTPKEKLSYLFAHMFESRYNDTNIYKGEIMSMQQVVADHGHDSQQFVQNLQKRLTGYFRRHFDDATVTVRDIDSENKARYTVSVDVIVAQDGEKYSLGHEIYIDPVAVTSKLLKEINK